MALSANQLQAMYARRRAMEIIRTERVQAVNRYYDQMGKETKRYESWTKPEYYEQADAQLRKKKEAAEKEIQLKQRREKMKTLFGEEQTQYDDELKNLNRSKPRARQTLDVDLLEKIAQQNKEREEIKRKLELESKLYGRWRQTEGEEKSLYDSKSDHQVLAKLNWLDKKVDEQMQREKEEAEAQERRLRIEEEQRKIQQAQLERQQLRAEEIKSVQASQEKHMEALKQRHEETQELRSEEKELRLHVRELTKEKELLEESSAYVREAPEIAQAFNVKKIKVLMRQRAETFANQIKLTINILERMRPYAIRGQQIEEMLREYRKDLEAEEMVVKKIDGMFDSEAKSNMQITEEAWQAKHTKRFNDVKRLIDDEHYMFTARLKENTSRQREIIELRERHVKAIEESNNKLGKLMTAQTAGDNPSNVNDLVVESMEPNKAIDDGAGDRASGRTASAAASFDTKGTNSDLSLSKVQSSFQNLNLDVWGNMEPTTRRRNETPNSESQRSVSVVSAQNAERPRFARKRVAWT